MTSICSRLKRARTGQGLSQVELAINVKKRFPNADVTQQSISQLESGESNTSGCLVEIAVTLGVNPVWLAIGEGTECVVNDAGNPLGEYLRKHGIEQKDFAARLKEPVSAGLVSQWIKGHTRITAKRARQIEAATSGEVTRKELRPDLFDDGVPANAIGAAAADMGRVS